MNASSKAGTSSYPGFAAFPIKATFLLIPFIVFYNLWPNRGATLYGEVRGVSDFRKNVYAMGGALLFTTVVVLVTFAAMAHAMGWNTYRIVSSAYWGYFTAPLAMFPYPGTLAAFFYHSEIVQVVIILLLSLWFFGRAGSVFLSSTRMIFASAFDSHRASVAAAGCLQRVADREVQDRRDTADHRVGCDLRRVPGVLYLQMAL